MIIELILEDDDWEDDNIISFADYAARRDARPRHIWSWEEHLLQLTGGNVISLADRRQ